MSLLPSDPTPASAASAPLQISTLGDLAQDRENQVRELQDSPSLSDGIQLAEVAAATAPESESQEGAPQATESQELAAQELEAQALEPDEVELQAESLPAPPLPAVVVAPTIQPPPPVLTPEPETELAIAPPPPPPSEEPPLAIQPTLEIAPIPTEAEPIQAGEEAVPFAIAPEPPSTNSNLSGSNTSLPTSPDQPPPLAPPETEAAQVSPLAEPPIASPLVANPPVTSTPVTSTSVTNSPVIGPEIAPTTNAEPSSPEPHESPEINNSPDSSANNETVTLTSLPSDNLATAQKIESVSFNRTASLTKSADLYQFSATESGVFTATITGLSGDADVQLIQDKNRNGQADAGEIMAWEWERGSQDESIRYFLSAGDYVLRVIDLDLSTAPISYNVATTFKPAKTDDRAFSINIIYKQGLDQLNAAAKQAIENAADYWENIISYSSFDRPLELAIGLYGTTNNSNPFLAYAGPQSYRDTGDSLLPVVGVAVLNNFYLDQYNSNPDYLESVLRHEFGHVLGFGITWDRQGNDLVDQDQGLYRAQTYAGQSYGELLGTGIATAVPLDRDSLTHWDETIFDAELMTPRAEGIGNPLPLSQLTLSSLRDLGWHVNYGAAEAFSLGNSAIA